MKHLSVRARVNLFYIVVIALMGVFLCAALLVATDIQISQGSAATVETAVKESAESISYYGDSIEIDPEFDFYNNNVTIVLYGPKGTPLAGAAPTGFSPATPLISDDTRTIHAEGDSKQWLVYDLYVRYSTNTGIWIRGIYSMESELLALRSLITVTIIAAPIILIFSIVFGMIITKRAFAPLSDMCESAKSITSGNDLSRRLVLHDTKDEFFELGTEINSMIERLEKAFENERQFASDVSHELKTPIAVILSQCEYAQGIGVISDNEAKEIIATIGEQGKRMSSLVSQLLELSRTFNVESALNFEEFDLSELVCDIADEMRTLASERKIEITCQAEENLVVCADQMQLIRMLVNLTTNSIRYGKQGGNTNISLACENDEIKLTVADNGIGIKQENLERIFEPFFKEDKSRKKEQNSFGLGLSYVRKIVEAHKGTIEVESVVGIGTKFTIHMPILKK